MALMRILWAFGIFSFSASIALALGRGSPIRRAYSSLQLLSCLFFAAGFCTVPLFHLVYREPLSRVGSVFVFRYSLLSLISVVALVLLAYCSYRWRVRHSTWTGGLAFAGLGVLFLCLTGLEWLGMWDIAYDLGSWELEVRLGILVSPWIALAVATASFGAAVIKGRRREWTKIVVMVLILTWLTAVLWSAASSAAVAADKGGMVSPQVPAVGVATSFLLLFASTVLFASVALKLWVTLSVTRWNRAYLPGTQQ